MTETALAATRRPSGFDAVLLVGAAAGERLGGMLLLERAAFVMARAGAHGILCVGRLPEGELRLPDLAVAWASDEYDVARWASKRDRTIVGLDAGTLVDEQTVSALVKAAEADALSAPGGRLWRCQTPSLPTIIAAALARNGHDTLPGTHRWMPDERGVLITVDGPAERARAERVLLERLGRPGDGWFTRVVDRRLSRTLTRHLLHTRLSPSQVTMLSITTGIMGGLLFAVGTYPTAAAGALLFLLSTILDGCDGELSRLTFRESHAGARLDVVGDNVVHVVLFAGIATGLYRAMPASYIVLLGAALLGGTGLAMASAYTCMVRRTPSSAQQRFFEAFASREFAYLLALLTIAGRVDWFLWLAAGGTYVYAVSLWLLGRVGTPTMH